MAKNKRKVMKQIEIDEQKNNDKNKYYYSIENKYRIKKPLFSLSRNIPNNFDNYSYNRKNNNINIDKDKKNIKETILPKINFNESCDKQPR